MANFEHVITLRAQDEAEVALERKKRATEEKAEAKLITAKADAAIKSADSAMDRLGRFDPIIDGDYQCPHCWIANETHSLLKPIPSDTRIDQFRCETCGCEISDE